MEDKIAQAIELLNRNGYIVSKVSKAQIAITQKCTHDKNSCNFNLLGIKCVDLLCIQDMICKQILPYLDEEKN